MMNVKRFPVSLNSVRLCIRPHQRGDEILLTEAITDSFDLLHEWMDWAATPQTLDKTKAYIEYSIKCWSEEFPRELPLLIFNTSQTQLLGAIAFNAIDWKIPSFEIGYWVNTHYSSQGFITEAVNILTQYAFSTWQAKRLEIRCDTENKKSAAIPERLGFQLEAHFKNHRVQPKSKKLSGTLIFVRYDTKGLPKL
ncbi:MAG: hypothetical protein BGO14_01135 [Chlamydiales bacterium 38-26]|nr:GNAT family N-acetyltransferase [Chlamydiales bacterium]OJV07324.1 MAG: hypothetical protein BGO14_01135 [Chlamydiales bacterium 38-26]